ncbi:hypothetical protein HPB52_003609 [Rhipicephalus sanguineus]|uniref:Uncharacterized protein n=1 Tax=Rhipicephalus sanguineus TaxID=34632 RepID=A0A9D4Q4D4_RHISA|nr:hypothetical protein HPB52_003609 [Rhipicephalus sanguineus]
MRGELATDWRSVRALGELPVVQTPATVAGADKVAAEDTTTEGGDTSPVAEEAMVVHAGYNHDMEAGKLAGTPLVGQLSTPAKGDGNDDECDIEVKELHHRMDDPAVHGDTAPDRHGKEELGYSEDNKNTTKNMFKTNLRNRLSPSIVNAIMVIRVRLKRHKKRCFDYELPEKLSASSELGIRSSPPSSAAFPPRLQGPAARAGRDPDRYDSHPVSDKDGSIYTQPGPHDRSPPSDRLISTSSHVQRKTMTSAPYNIHQLDSNLPPTDQRTLQFLAARSLIG